MRTALCKSEMLESEFFKHRFSPKNQESHLQQVGSDLEKIVAQSLRNVPPAEAPLMAWPVVCGSAVAERTRAIKFEDGVLHVAVLDSGWKLELQALAPRYLVGLNRYAHTIVRRIEFVVAKPDNSGRGVL